MNQLTLGGAIVPVEYTYTPKKGNDIIGVFKRKIVSVEDGCDVIFAKKRYDTNPSNNVTKIKDVANDSPHKVTYSEIALYIISKMSKNLAIIYGSICIKNIYQQKKYTLKSKIEEFEKWSEKDDFTAMENYIKSTTRVASYSGKEYSALVGAHELLANRLIEKGELLGNYSGKIIAKSEFFHLRYISRPKWFIVAYSFEIPGSNNLILDGSNGNQMHYINDGFRKDDSGNIDANRCNAEFFVIYKASKIDGKNVSIPHVYVVANKEIKSGDPIWLNYGESYWSKKMP